MDEHGQASIEWLGVVAFVAAVVITLGVVAGSGASAAAAVVRQMHRALCIVSGGVCDLDRRPCVVTANAIVDAAHVNLGIVRVGRDELILVEHRSDGTVLVTYLHDTSAGIELGVGADWWVRAGALDLAVGDTARAALLASLGGGQTWLFADGAQADRGMAFLGEGSAPPGGTRVQTIERTGGEATAGAVGEVRDGALRGRIDVDAKLVRGRVVDERTGRRTVVVSVAGSGTAGALLEVGRSDAAATARGGGQVEVAVTSDADGRALELSVVRTGQLEGAGSLPDAVQAIAGGLVGDGAAGRRWVVEQRLDLTDPENLAAARSLMGALADPGGAPEAVAAVAGRLTSAGVTEASTYALRTEDGGGFGGHVAVGVKLGGAIEDRSERTTLLDDRVRGADGAWRTRSECLAAVGGVG